MVRTDRHLRNDRQRQVVGIRAAGFGVLALAALPWLFLSSPASASVVPRVATIAAAKPPAATTNPLLDGKWNGTSDTDAGLSSSSCDFQEINDSHSGVGWHFVLPGTPSDMSSFSAHFASAGTITVTTTETANGVIVQSGKGAVIFTPGHDTLTSLSTWHDANGDHAGRAVNNGANDHYLQLSHICSGGGTPTETPTVVPTETETSTPTVVPTETETSTPTVAPTETETSTPTVAPTETETSTPTVAPTETETTTPTGTVTPSVLGTSAVKTPTSPTPTPTTSVLGISHTLPQTGFPTPAALALSAGLIGLGALLVFAPGRLLSLATGRRRH